MLTPERRAIIDSIESLALRGQTAEALAKAVYELQSAWDRLDDPAYREAAEEAEREDQRIKEGMEDEE